ncbi:hypothetical protein TEQG_00926 [Trichophyton equinum CBS 127.97]|uniref:Uncharacterized protein n=1 Tax=Trichophyton equinum (strain ATCC MYA-4606 / CBS 127.97) TaxID=559882 RepID=F2PJ17_TRIEC|nr:hypothetical protein TEQG_00926 [Trichophyton equinum CBS 127.97]
MSFAARLPFTRVAGVASPRSRESSRQLPTLSQKSKQRQPHFHQPASTRQCLSLLFRTNNAFDRTTRKQVCPLDSTISPTFNLLEPASFSTLESATPTGVSIVTMRASLLACLAIGGLAGGAFSAILPREWPTGDFRLGRETLSTTGIQHPTLRMTKAAFAPFQNATASTRAAATTLPLAANIVDEPTFLTTSYMPYTSTISVVEKCHFAGKKVTTQGKEITSDAISKPLVGSEPNCLVANTVTVTITEILFGTTVLSTPTPSATKKPTLNQAPQLDPS